MEISAVIDRFVNGPLSDYVKCQLNTIEQSGNLKYYICEDDDDDDELTIEFYCGSKLFASMELNDYLHCDGMLTVFNGNQHTYRFSNHAKFIENFVKKYMEHWFT